MVLLIDEAAVVRRDAGVLRVTGADRHAYLHSLFSQDLESAPPGTVADFLYLDAKGNAQAEGRAIVAAGAIVLVTPRDVGPSLAEALGRFTFLMDAATEDLTDQWVVASVRAREPVSVGGARSEPMTAVPREDGLVVRDRSGGVDLVGPVAWVERVVRELDLPEAGPSAWEAWRIDAGLPAWDSEIIPGRRPQELGVLPTHVHLRKGCYPGQESVAKIYNLGRPRRCLMVVDLDGEVAPGDTVTVGGKTGEVTSVADTGGAWVALALLPADADGDVGVGDVRGRIRGRVGAGLAIPGA